MDRQEIPVRIGKEGWGMLKGFRDFIMRGNVVDLAVGIVIGAAFTSIVTQFTTDFVNPLIHLFGGGGVKSGKWTVNGSSFLWADFVNAIITFLIVAAVLYFLVVMPLNKLAERRNRNQPPTPAQVSDEVALLMQIRDELAAANREIPAQRTGRQTAPVGNDSDTSNTPRSA